MIIDQLPEISSVQDTDEIPVERGTTTYKSPLSKLWTRALAALKATTAPVMDGTAAIGSATKFALADHVHPSDTTRASVADLATFPRPNLLYNWFFEGGGSQLGEGIFPINQRGQTSYTGGGYTIDGWKAGYSADTVNVYSLSVRITVGSSTSAGFRFYQTLENGGALAGRTITASFRIYTVNGSYLRPAISFRDADDNEISLIGGETAPIEGMNTVSGTVPSNTSKIRIGFRSYSGVATGDYVSIRSAKLEVGDTQTLAYLKNGTRVMTEIPDFKTELLKCYRYFYRLNTNSTSSPDFLGVGFGRQGSSSTSIFFTFILPTTMRKNPTISNAATALKYFTTETIANALTPTSVSGFYWAGNQRSVYLSAPNIVAGTPYGIALAANSYIDFSAEI